MPPSSGHTSSRARRIAFAVITGAILPIALTASPVAAANTTRIVSFHGDCAFDGSNAGDRRTVGIEWRDSDGRLKSKHRVTSRSDGTWSSRCEFEELIESGDVIKTTNGGATRTFNVPKLTVNVDREADDVFGFGPPNSTMTLIVETYEGGFAIADQTVQTTPTFGDGTYAFGFFTSGADIKGWDDVYAQWTNARGDEFWRYVPAEGVQVWIGQPWANIVGNPGENVQIDLTNGVSTTFGTTGGRLDFWGERRGQFLDDDVDSVRPAVSQTIDCDFATDADFVIPDFSAIPNPGTDRVAGDCGGDPDIGWFVRVHTRSYSAEETRTGFTTASGDFNARFDQSPTYNIRSGDKVDVFCKRGSGDVVARSYTVP
jgi:hypothetical protein